MIKTNKLIRLALLGNEDKKTKKNAVVFVLLSVHSSYSRLSIDIICFVELDTSRKYRNTF